MNEQLVDFIKYSIPLKIEYTENKGRYVVATQDIKKDTKIVAIKGYSTGIIDSFKKKICSVCLSINNEGFYDISCKSCNIAYYCSKACQMYSQRKLNHELICSLLRKLATFKSDIHSKSIMKLLINSLSLKKSEEEYMRLNSSNDNIINNWLSTVPLPSDIEEYEKELEELKLKVIDNNCEKNNDNNIDKNHIDEEELNKNTGENKLNIDNQESISSSEDEEKKKKDKKKKKHKKKDKEEKEMKKHKKDKKKEKEKINDNVINENEINKKEKSKHKHSKHHKKDIETNEEEKEDKNIDIINEKDVNSEKYDTITNTIPYSGTYNDMMNLQSHFEEWTDDMKREWQKNINFFKKLIQESKEIYKCMEDVIQESKNNSIEDINMDTEVANYLMHFASLVESNSFGIWNNKGKCIGRIIYPFASYFNHSCRNNCYPVQYKNHIYFFASKDIKKGDEVNFSYIDTAGVSLKERQAHLLADYYFKCQCELCCEEENEIISSLNNKKKKKKAK